MGREGERLKYVKGFCRMEGEGRRDIERKRWREGGRGGRDGHGKKGDWGKRRWEEKGGRRRELKGGRWRIRREGDREKEMERGRGRKGEGGRTRAGGERRELPPSNPFTSLILPPFPPSKLYLITFSSSLSLFLPPHPSLKLLLSISFSPPPSNSFSQSTSFPLPSLMRGRRQGERD